MKSSMVPPVIAAALVVAGCGAEPVDDRIIGELASDRHELAAESSEPIVAVLVEEGVRVAAGDALVKQDDARARARLAELEAVLGEASARLDEFVRGPRREQIDAARADVTGAERELEFRATQHERARELEAKQLASPQDLDRAKADLDAAHAALDQRRARLDELLAGTTLEELKQAENVLRQAEARRDSARIDLDRLTIRAPVDGLTDVRLFELGERPSPGQPIMVMLSGEQPYARVFVPERLRARVAPGMSALIHIDGLEQPIDGRVRWVSTEAAYTPYFALTERDRGRLSFLAKVDLIGARERLPDGVPVEVDFVLDKPANGR